jgi:hypothetical protein
MSQLVFLVANVSVLRRVFLSSLHIVSHVALAVVFCAKIVGSFVEELVHPSNGCDSLPAALEVPSSSQCL